MIKDLREIIEKRGMTLGKLVYKTDISKGTLSKIQNGKLMPRIDTVCKIAKALNMEPNELFTALIANEPWS